MAKLDLRVIICNMPAGTLHQDEAGLITFQYDEGYTGVPLSLSMSLSNQPYQQEVVKPYLFGLLPDSEEQRKAIADEFGVRPNNPVALLDCIGLDCPGGVQFCRPENEGAVLTREGSYRPLTEHQIARKLKAIRDDADVTWMGEGESWSLGGNQGKFALAWRDGAWCECLGSAATTHIFKNGVRGFKLQALNEYICMRTALWSDIPTASVEYLMFEDEPAIVIERYDRKVENDGTILRLHQEDFCQALSVMPNQKYTSDGGPTTQDAVALLASTDSARINMLLFTRMLFYNYLIGAPDAHAKNYSLILGAGRNAALARMYDVASGLAYESLRRHGRLAMGIGGENRFGRVSAAAIERYGKAGRFEELGARPNTCIGAMLDLAYMVPQNLADIFDQAIADGIPGAAELRGHMEDPIVQSCEHMVKEIRSSL